MIRLSFHGAAQGVTGSCHLLDTGGVRLLVDCGWFQGSRDAMERNGAPFPFDPSSIDYLLLTHAHLDHCGRIPLLVDRGFTGEIIATDATRELTRLILLDSAKLQEEDARRAQRRAGRRGQSDGKPLYDTADALRAFDLFGRAARYGRTMRLKDGVTARFINAGHILGSAAVVVEAGTAKARRRILFSGDLGNDGRPILPDPTPPPEADYVVMECTYGDRRHRDMAASKAELIEVIAEALARGGNVLIPSFAMQRTQELLFCLREATESGDLPRHLPVFLDSPLAINVGSVFARHAELFQPPAEAMFRAGKDPCALPGLRYVRDASESMALNNVHGGAVIIAGSGMCTGGRIRHHFKHNLWRRNASVVFIGFAAEGTPARRIIDGAKSIRLFGEPVQVKARIHTINGFSAHADRDELLRWLSHAGTPKRVFLVHGDPRRGMAGMARVLKAAGHTAARPALGETVPLA